MNLDKNGETLRRLRKAKGLTQKQVADRLGVVPKTVSKWETGNGFPDVSTVSALADILGTSERILLSGELVQNEEESGNMKKTKFYVCPHCGGIMYGVGKGEVLCCGKQLEPLSARDEDEGHTISVTETDGDVCVSFNHEMNKEHYIAFAAYVAFDRVLTVRLYPEQDSAVRFPKMYGGSLYFYCSRHGLFCHKSADNKKKRAAGASLTALMSAFARAYHTENGNPPIFRDEFARKMFSDEEYERISGYIAAGADDIEKYINTQLAPVPVSRAKFCEEAMETARKTGTNQFVVLGSGYDTAALKYSETGICSFELDRTATILDKKKRLARGNITLSENLKFVPADLARESLAAALIRSGFDKRKKTLFSCLGLLYYMNEKQISRLFAEISRIASEGSAIVFDFGDSHIFSSEVPRVREMLKMAEESGEPMKSCFGYQALEKMLEEHGFLIYEFLSDKDIQDRYFKNSSDGLKAFENVNLALAVKKL